MSSAITFTEADIDLIVAIFKQLEISTIGKKVLQDELGLNSVKVTAQRLSRFKIKLASAQGYGAPPQAPKPLEKRQAGKKLVKTEDGDDDSTGGGASEGSIDWRFEKQCAFVAVCATFKDLRVREIRAQHLNEIDKYISETYTCEEDSSSLRCLRDGILKKSNFDLNGAKFEREVL